MIMSMNLLRPSPDKLTGIASVRCLTHHVSSRKLTTPASAPKPFKEIPGPKGYPLIGTALDYRNDKYNISRVIKRRFDEYGHIYRERIPGLSEQVVIFDPKDIEAVFRADGDVPERPTTGADMFDGIFKAAGISSFVMFFLKGERWRKIRSPMSKFIMVPRKVAEYHEDFNNITLDLLKNIEMKKDPDTSVLTDVPTHFFNWSFESVAYFLFGKRLGALSIEGASPESQEFITTVDKVFGDLLSLMMSPPLYKVFPTKRWKDVVNGEITMHRIGKRFVNEKLSEIEEEQRKTLEAASGEEEAPETVDFVTYLVHSGKMSIEDVTALSIDLLSAGVETTSYTLCWMLYLLANNPEAQEKLRNEIQSAVGSDQIVTPAHISEMSYLRQVLKETQRLYPVAAIHQRVLQSDVILSGYSVPKGSEVSIPQILTARMPEYFPEPERFLPERWSKENKDKLPSSFTILPFGFGARMCVGRRLAELEMFIAISQLIREYKVEYLDKEPMDYIQNFLIKPDRQLNLVFKKL